MNLCWLILSFISTLHWTTAAPAVSSVHVSFVSGNKATQYSHGTGGGGAAGGGGGGDGTLIQYNLVDKGGMGQGEEHMVRKRSVGTGTTTAAAPPEYSRHGSTRIAGKIKVPHRTTTPTTTTTTTRGKMGLRVVTIRMPTRAATTMTYEPPSMTTRGGGGRDIDTTENFSPTTTITSPPDTKRAIKAEKKRVRFIPPKAEEAAATTTTTTGRTSTRSTSAGKREEVRGSTVAATNPVAMTGTRLDAELLNDDGTTVATTTTGTSDKVLAAAAGEKVKDTKAVKRSPFLGNNFLGSFAFPNFDDFGGSDLGSFRSFARPSGGGGGGGSDGAGSRTSYSQHNPESLAPEGVFMPPLPTEASHYVTNDPYLADPDTAKYASQHPPFFHEFPHKRTVLALNERREENGLEPNLFRSIRPFFPFFETSNSYGERRRSGKYFFDDLEPTVVLYAEQLVHHPVESWNLFTVV